MAKTEDYTMPAERLLLIAETAAFISRMTDREIEDTDYCNAHDTFLMVWGLPCTGSVELRCRKSVMSVVIRTCPDTPRPLVWSISTYCELSGIAKQVVPWDGCVDDDED